MVTRPSLAPVALYVAAALALASCAKIELPAPHEAPLPTEAVMLLGKKQMTSSQPIFIRIFKAESELEVWKQRDDGYFHHFRTYPICNWSGELGPKHKTGDKQSPEGFYEVRRHQMNPNSKFHLSFDLGFPNAYDRANGRTGNFLMVHGKCSSAGCYAMTDGLIEEIYALARESFAGGQKVIHTHVFPFRMTEQNLALYHGDRNVRFWRTLKQGHDYFDVTRQVPSVEVCERRYHVNVERVDRRSGSLDPAGACPRFQRGPIVAFAAGAGIAGGTSASVPAVATPRPAAFTTRTVPATAEIRYHAPSNPRPMTLAPPR